MAITEATLLGNPAVACAVPSRTNESWGIASR
jgi:hypothetical protein